MNVLRPEIPLGIDERAPLALDVPARVDVHDRDLDHPVVPARAQPGGLEIDDGVHPRDGNDARRVRGTPERPHPRTGPHDPFRDRPSGHLIRTGPAAAGGGAVPDSGHGVAAVLAAAAERF
ncbi:hypothetical protein ACQP1P_40180 [Dactylosporangium sp. CA-052675]|uniref:hypothetical protein n=1 Tax=Dactylosporangium sp. CA-052675 TaxID=3239927 RepID=UPI003D904E25